MVDVLINGKAYGSVAQKLLANGMDVNVLRGYIGSDGRAYFTNNGKAVPTLNATLRKDEWKHYDTAVIKAAQERLIGVADLYSRGLTYSIPNGLGTTVLEYEDISDISAAQMSMDGISRSKSDRPEFDINYLPLPIIHKDYQINSRVLASSRNTGAALDTTMAELAARMVAEKLEDILFNGASAYTFGGGTIRGYTDHPSRNTVSLTANWDASAATGETILTDALAMKQASIEAKYYGPWVMYIPTGYETVIDGDFKSNSDKSTRQRILEVDGIQDIKVSDKLTANNVLLVQMTSDVVRMVQGLAITPVEWESEGNMVHHFKVMTIQVPQIRSDQNGNCGVTHAS